MACWCPPAWPCTSPGTGLVPTPRQHRLTSDTHADGDRFIPASNVGLGRSCHPPMLTIAQNACRGEHPRGATGDQQTTTLNEKHPPPFLRCVLGIDRGLCPSPMPDKYRVAKKAFGRPPTVVALTLPSAGVAQWHPGGAAGRPTQNTIPLYDRYCNRLKIL